MGMSKLNIWVSKMDDPCSVSDRTWYITIYDCDGRVLQWCGKTYLLLPAKCGHLEIEVPPGCYYIKGVWGYTAYGGRKFWANHFTDTAIVQACCEKTTCIKLFNPSIHRCGIIYVLALKDMVKQKLIKPTVANEAIKAINNVLKAMPEPEKGFEIAHQPEIEKTLAKLVHRRKK